MFVLHHQVALGKKSGVSFAVQMRRARYVLSRQLPHRTYANVFERTSYYKLSSVLCRSDLQTAVCEVRMPSHVWISGAEVTSPPVVCRA